MINITNEDSLRTQWTNKFDRNKSGIFDNILSNPPYVKFQNLSNKDRLFLINNWETISNGTFNLYFAFFELGYKLLNEKGKLGYITPNNYFTSISGKPLRLYFQNKQCIYKIIDFKDKKIFNAQTYTAITFLDRNAVD